MTLKLAAILDVISASNTRESWERLFLFSRRCLQAPKRGGRRRNLSGLLINHAIAEELDVSPPPQISRRTNPDKRAARVSSKLEDGDFRGAVRVASSRDNFCTPDERSLHLLRAKHSPPHADTSLPDFQTPGDPLVVASTDVAKAIQSFPSGSAGGHDGLLPQHLKDLISPNLGLDSLSLMIPLTNFINKVISGGVPIPACPFFFAANLIGLNKTDGGVRPMAIGYTLRCLAAKCVCTAVKEEIGSLPHTVGIWHIHGS